MKHYFEYSDSKSHKFWQIEVEDCTSTVRYGKIGTAGQEKVTTYDTPEKAQKDAAKLIAEKVRKGYFLQQDPSVKKISKRIVADYEDQEKGTTLLDKLQHFVESAQAANVDALVFGSWAEPYEESPQESLDYLVAHSARLPKLRELFVGDMDGEECEISWIIQGNYTAVFAAFPQLERLHIKGASSLVLHDGALRHAGLKALTIECGGLSKSVIATIAEAELPALEYLNLYLGVDEYGFDGTLEDLRPFMSKERFPRLKYLALSDSELADDIAREIAEAPVLDILETLDLSKGTLSDAGGAALLASSRIPQLKRLDLHHHYLSKEMMVRLKALGPIVDLTEQQDEDSEWRYPAVTE